MAPPAPAAAPRHAASVHDQLTLVAVLRPGSAAVHDPTVVDRVLPPPVPRQAVTADRVTAQGGRAEARRAMAGRAVAGRHRKGVGPEHLRRIVPQALVVVFLAGGTSAFLAHDKAVTLNVDGRPRTLHTFADDVGELLDAEGVTVGAHDLVAPAPGTALDDGDEVAVRRSAQRGALPWPRRGRTLNG